MKFFVAFAALIAVALASPVKPVASVAAELEAIVAAINSPSTDPATAALLEQQLQEILAAANPIEVSPVIVEEPVYEPISVGPALVDFPVPDGGAVSAPVAPSPVVIGPIAPGAPTPLVQIIVNVKNADSTVSPVGVIAPQPEIQPTPVTVVDSAPIAVEPVQVVDVAPVPAEPVQVVDVAPVPAEPVQVVEAAPVPVEPVIIGTPIIPSPAVVLPETLN